MSSEAAGGLGSPPQETQSPIIRFVKHFVSEFQRDDIMGLSAEIAYHLIFAVPPLIILTVMASALLNQYTHVPVVATFHRLVDQHAPGDLQPVLDSVITNAVDKVGGGAASIGAAVTAILALWSASNGIGSFMKAFNRVYDVDEGRPYVKKKLVALGLTLALIILIICAFALFVFGRQIGNLIADQIGVGGAFNTAWGILRWPVAILFVMGLLWLLYYYGPNVEQEFRWVWIGAVAATVLWIAAVFGFKLYLSLSNPGSTYGAFGGLIVFLFFLYITALVFVIGAELNAIVDKRMEHDMVGTPSEPLKTTDRGMANGPTRPSRQRMPGFTERTSPAEMSITSPEMVTPRPNQASLALRASGMRAGTIQLAAGFAAASLLWAVGWLIGRRGS